MKLTPKRYNVASEYEMRKLTKDEIINYLSVNQDTRKRVMLHNIEDIAKVNDLLTEDDINTLINDSTIYDALYDYEHPFSDLLDDFFMGHLDVKENTNDVMCWLHSIYS